MKIISNITGLILVYTILISPVRSALPEIPEEAKAAQIWKDNRLKNINEFEEKPKAEMISGIGEMLRQLTALNYRDCDEKYYIIDSIQFTLVSIPGHAQFFADRVHAAYEPLKGLNPGNFKSSAQSEMMYSFETLKNLPSPETVRVLGEMLSETWQLPLAGEYTPPALAYPAMTTLGDLGIRNAPWKPIIIAPDAEGGIPAWQAWWEEVKSGKRSFSFVGQKSEYRFKPDGTWDTIPVSLPPGEVVPKAPITVTPEAVAIPPVHHQNRTWLWIISLSFLLLAVVGWLLRKKRRV